MDFEFSEEQKLVRQTARDFAQNELKPIASDIDKEHVIPESILNKLKQMGFFGVYIPEDYGGAGLDYISYIIVIEEIAKVCASTAVVLSVHNSLVCNAIYMFGNEEQKKRYLPGLSRGEKIGCFMLTEPGAGSDAASIATTCEDKGDYFLVNGNKIFATNGGFKGIGILFATHDRSLRHKGIDAFVLDLVSDGVELLRNEDKMGLRGSYTSAFALNNVKVPKENLLDGYGNGFKIAMELLNGGRISIAAQALGIAEGAFEMALEYSKERKQFGKPISSFQAIQFKLADMAMKIESARLLTYRAAWLKNEHKNFIIESAIAKTVASETANYVVKEAMQIFGGYGYITDYGIERYYRDAKITEIYEGTNEIQKLLIAKQLLK